MRIGALSDAHVEESRERALGIMINPQVVPFSTFGLEIGFPRFSLGSRNTLPNLEPLTGLLSDLLLQTAIISLVGISLLYLGKRELDSIE